MATTAQTSEGFVDPFQMPQAPFQNGWTFSSGLPGAFSELIGLDHNQRVEAAKLMDDRRYERQSIDSARAWSEYMDNTAVQRRVKDIEAAGLNPWLAVQSGISGTGAPSVDTGGTAQHSRNSGQSKGGVAGLIASIIKLIAS